MSKELEGEQHNKPSDESALVKKDLPERVNVGEDKELVDKLRPLDSSISKKLTEKAAAVASKLRRREMDIDRKAYIDKW